MPLEQYLKLFASLKRAPGSIWNEATLRKAPHKPILLLAVIDLVSRGVSSSRIETISYGKEKPIDGGSNEQAWQQNRNAQTQIVSGQLG